MPAHVTQGETGAVGVEVCVFAVESFPLELLQVQH